VVVPPSGSRFVREFYIHVYIRCDTRKLDDDASPIVKLPLTMHIDKTEIDGAVLSDDSSIDSDGTRMSDQQCGTASRIQD